jgi:hypothetical protein
LQKRRRIIDLRLSQNHSFGQCRFSRALREIAEWVFWEWSVGVPGAWLFSCAKGGMGATLSTSVIERPMAFEFTKVASLSFERLDDLLLTSSVLIWMAWGSFGFS